MRTRPWFHARRSVPLTGREPVLGPLLTRMAWCGPGWGLIALQGESGSGLTRLLDEIVRRRTAEGAPAPIRIGPAPDDEQPLEPLRRALVEAVGHAGREPTFLRLAAALGGKRGAARRLVDWMLDGPDAGAPEPEPALVAEALRALSTTGPLIADDLMRLDPASREIVEGEGGSGGIGVLAATTATGRVADDLWHVPPLGEAQVDLLLRRWLRHPVTVRRLSGPVLERTGGLPGRIVRTLRALGRSGALVGGARGVQIASWPLAWTEDAEDELPFQSYLDSLDGAERAVFEVAALQASEDDTVLLARAAGVKARVVSDLRVEIQERWPRAGGGLFPSITDRAQLAGRLDPERQDEHAQGLLRAWNRRPVEMDRGVRDAFVRLRIAVLADDPAARMAARELIQRFVPAGRVVSPALARLLDAAGGGLRRTSPPDLPDFFPASPTDDVLGRPEPADRMAEARRLLREADLPGACAVLQAIGTDETLPAVQRVEAWIRLAHTRLRAGDELGAHEAVRQAAARLEDGGPEAEEDAVRLRRLLALTSGVLGAPFESA